MLTLLAFGTSFWKIFGVSFWFIRPFHAVSVQFFCAPILMSLSYIVFETMFCHDLSCCPPPRASLTRSTIGIPQFLYIFVPLRIAQILDFEVVTDGSLDSVPLRSATSNSLILVVVSVTSQTVQCSSVRKPRKCSGCRDNMKAESEDIRDK